MISASEAATADRGSEAFLLNSVARGHEESARALFDAHGEYVWGLLRLTLGSAEAAEGAMRDTFSEVAWRAGELRPKADALEWMRDLALEQVEVRAKSAQPISLDEVRRQARETRRALGKPVEGSHLVVTPLVEEGDEEEPLDLTEKAMRKIGDSALGVMVRMLEPRRRHAVVLSLNLGLPDERVARVLGCEQSEIAKLRHEALDSLGSRLKVHLRRDLIRRKMATEAPYHLRPLHGQIMRGNVVVKGQRAYIEPLHPSLLMRALHAIERVLHLFFRRPQDKFEEDDEVGGHKPRKRPDPTPPMRPFEKPKRTPSLTDYVLPPATRGTAVYAAARKYTPSTQPLSARRQNPLPTGTMSHRGYSGRKSF